MLFDTFFFVLVRNNAKRRHEDAVFRAQKRHFSSKRFRLRDFAASLDLSTKRAKSSGQIMAEITLSHAKDAPIDPTARGQVKLPTVCRIDSVRPEWAMSRSEPLEDTNRCRVPETLSNADGILYHAWLT